MTGNVRLADATRYVLAALAGLVAAAVGVPLLAALGVLAGRGIALRLVCALVALAALTYGQARVEQLSHRPLHPGRFDGTVTVIAQPNAGRALAADHRSGETVVLVDRNDRLELGGIYRVIGRLEPIDTVVRDYYATQGAHLDLRAETAGQRGFRGGLWGLVDSLHRAAAAIINPSGEQNAQAGLVAGFTLGDPSAIPNDQKDQLRSSGLYHLVAASGQNIALVTILVIVVLGVSGVVGTPARIAAAVTAVGYVLIAGAGPSIVRAGVAGALVISAWLVSRPVQRWHLLACGALVVLALNPLEVADPGFQLSFAAVIAIYELVPRLRRHMPTAIAVSVACTVVTTPISWWHFGRLAPLSVPANLLVLPVEAAILWLGLAGVAAGSIWPPAAVPPLTLAKVLAGYVLWVAALCS